MTHQLFGIWTLMWTFKTWHQRVRFVVELHEALSLQHDVRLAVCGTLEVVMPDMGCGA